MEIWLKGTKNFRFPINPSEYTVTSEHGSETVDVNALGEIDLGGKRKLRKISFSSFFPARRESYSQYASPSPHICVETIEQIKSGSPARIVITGTPINFKCRILSFEWGECDGSGDIRFSISLQEHRAVSVKASAVVTLSSLEGDGTTVDGNGVARTQPEQAAKTYTVKSGDCLSVIARKMTGSADWRALYNANKSVIGGNPNLIKPGQVLTIP